ncbi:fasciclin domain-containing protein [Nonlabens xiamenensis]|uniref:fasciclin domain-containing protein n=1 Tax=Nonlabens xiamenensis TaxID=2341043 RepID=UPI000F607EC4|nr:fasciclin domain-containing protein [Nonlabens xiamenensis]
MKLSNFFILSTIACFLTTGLHAQCHSSKQTNTTSTDHNYQVVKTNQWSYHETPDIVDIALSDKKFSTLVAAVKAADLVETLKGDGPFTVFAPTNSAFNRLPDGVVDDLLKPKNRKKLQSVLTYHVVAGKVTAADIIDSIKRNGGGFMTKTVQGQNLYASLKNGEVVLTDEQGRKSIVTATDIEASNGVVHVIDTVILPKG